MTDDPIVVTRDELLTEWRRTHPGECSCPPRKVDPSCPQHGTGRYPVTVPQEAITAAGNALRHRWLNERPNVVLPSFGLDPMEWAATALKAAAPHIAAAAYGQGRDDEAAGEPIPDWIRQLTEGDTT